MKGNYFKCGNEVFIEGVSIGKFASIEITEERDTIEKKCTVQIPIYAIGITPDLSPQERIRQALENIEVKVGAQIRIEGWYYDNPTLGQTHERLVLFSGFIKEVQSGFPTTLICEDSAFILRFGTIEKDWKSRTSLKTMVEYLLPKCNDAFNKYRVKAKFKDPDNFTPLKYDNNNSASIEFALQTFSGISPYDAIAKLINMFTLYGDVSPEGAVYVGIGVREKQKRTVKLNTKENVINRKLVAKNGMFTNYKVVVSGLMKDGTRYTYEYGDSEGEAERRYCPLNTQEGIKQVARSVMANLQGIRNAGTISTILYPVVSLFDFTEYTDTLFPELSGKYYVIGRTLSCDEHGFVQTITVTDEIFAL